MKSRQLLSAVYFLLLSAPCFTQTTKEISKTPFAKGIHSFDIIQNIGYTNRKPTVDNVSYGHSNDLNLNINYHYFIVNHLGVGLEFSGQFSGDHYNNGEFKFHDWLTYLDLIYGTTIGRNLNIYGKLSAGLGENNFISPNNLPTDNRTKISSYRLQAGTPFHIFNDGNVYITPEIGYTYQKEKSGGAKTTDKGFNFGIRFQSYLHGSDFSCDSHSGRQLSRNSYDAGKSFIGVGTSGGSSLMHSNSDGFESDNNAGQFDLEYGYYFIKNVAIGTNFNWSGQKQEFSNSKYSNSQWMISPVLTANLPVNNYWNNLFLQAGVGFGNGKTIAGSSTKTNLTSYRVDLGFNSFFSQHVSLTPKFGYEWEKSKNKSSGFEIKWHGIELGIGASIHF